MIGSGPMDTIVVDVSTDLIDEAIDTICELYRADLQRKPSKFEIRDMFELVLAPRYDLSEAHEALDSDETSLDQ